MLEAAEALAVDRVSVSLAGRAVLHEVSFALGAGDFCGLIGANGSGKTTLIRTILGLQAPDAGAIRIAGGKRPASIGYVPQKIALDPYMPVRARDLVALGLDGHRLGLPWAARARRAPVEDMLRAVGADAFADRRIGELSGGQQQRVLIAYALIRRPRLLLLDEPLANLDIASVAEIVSLLRGLAAAHRITVLLSAHDMNPLLPAMDRIVYVANGRVASGTTAEVVRTDVLSRLYGYHIDVIRVHGRVLVIAAGSEAALQAAMARDPVHVAAVP